jgi:hypothetical protein
MTNLEIIQRNQPEKQEIKLLTAALLCGCINYLLFYGKEWGVSYPLFVLVFYMYFYWAIRERHELRFDKGLLFLMPVALLSLTYAAFSNQLFMILNALAIPCLILAHTTWIFRKKDVPWFEPGMVLAVLEQLFVHSLRYVPLPVQTVIRLVPGKMRTGHSQLWKVMAGLAISLPILLLVGSLLASADAVFERTVSRLPEWLADIELGWLLFRIVWVVSVSMGMFVYIWGLLYPKIKPENAKVHRAENEADFERKFGSGRALVPTAGETEGSGTVGDRRSSRLDPTIMTTILLMLNIVYVLFATVQFSYFFGGSSLPEGLTYAEYARRGFAELVAVTLINFSVLMITLYGVDRSSRLNRALQRLLTLLLTMLVGCTGIMLCSAYLRLSLYEVAYGYTVTRVLVHAFMIFLLLLFIIALFKLWNNNLRLMKLYLVTSVAAYVLLNYVQVDAIIASNNMERYEETEQLDMTYLQSLSFEAVPYLIELHHKHPEIPGTEEALRVMKQRLDPQVSRSWTEFNMSEWRASAALAHISLEVKEPLQP